MADPTDQIMAQIAARIGGTVQQAARQFTLDPFTFGIDFLPIAASNTVTNNFITQADSGFAIVKTAFTIADATNVFIANISTDIPGYAPLVVTLSDSGSGRDLSNTPVSINTYFGTAKEPFIWARPKVLDPNSTFTARMLNLVATAFNVRLSFHGFKIFGNVAAFKNR